MGQFKSRGVERGINVAEMRMRMRLLDALEAANDRSLQLEDADWELFKALATRFQFGLAHRDLVQTS
jgi:hypothetical protein